MERCYGSPAREWLHPERFCDEPVYCEAPHNPDDVLYHGSDDEAYQSPGERRRRCEAQARRFLEGKPLFLLSASLRGPFDSKSGWVNPWRSRSACGTKPSLKKRLTAPREVVEPNDSSRVFGSSNYRPQTPEASEELPEATFTTPRYMDRDVFHRVWSWRDEVLANADPPASSIQCLSQPEPASADSRRATQQTTRRQSGWTVDTLGDEPRTSEPCTPSLVSKVERRDPSRISKRKQKRAASSTAAKVGQILAQKQAAVSQNRSSSAVPETTDILPPDSTNLSLGTERIHEQSALSGDDFRLPAAEETASEAILSEETTAVKAHAGKGIAEATSTTPKDVSLEATASCAMPKTVASCRTDGSFRYQRKGAPQKGASTGRSRLSRLASAIDNSVEHSSPIAQASSENAPEENEVPRSSSERNIRSPSTATVPEADQGLVPVAAEEQQESPAGSSEPEASQSDQTPVKEPAECCKESDARSERESQIDGPTLVYSGSASDSEHPSMPSFGHFSAEKQSQDTISDGLGLPRRLLWPKTWRSASGDTLPIFGITSAQPSASREAEPVGLKRCCSVTPTMSAPEEGNAPQPVEATEATKVSSEEPVQASSVKRQQHAGEAVEEDAAPAAEGTAESETASELGGEEIHGTEQLPAEVGPEAGREAANAEPEVQPTFPPAPEVQTPWAKDHAAPLSPRPRDPNSPPGSSKNVEMAHAGSSPPKATTQSPWVKQADILPGPSGTTAHILQLNSGDPKPFLITSQALEQAVSHSPWTRGDSQMQLPAASLSNPLSSPTNSNVLPSTVLASQSKGPFQDDSDIEVRNSQLYPPQPSTPETKRSGLPTPDFSLSVKSFKGFMTPSPQPAAKRRRISAAAEEGHLPNTQALLDAATSNPWSRPPSTKPKTHKTNRKPKQKQQKRVSWGPLPGEGDEPSTSIDIPTISSPCGAELAASSSTPFLRKQNPTRLPPRNRTASPPPSILSSSKLPSTDEKFGRHFAAVAGRRVGATTLRRRGTPLGSCPQKDKNAGGGEMMRLLPSASQQVCGSPTVGAMAEASLGADHPGAVAPAGADSVLLLARKRAQQQQQQQPVLGHEYEQGAGYESFVGAGAEGGAGRGWLCGGGGGVGGDEETGMGMSTGVDKEMEMGMDVDEPEPGEEVETQNTSAADDAIQDDGEEQENDDDDEDGLGILADEEPKVDDVSAVMENLDDFLGNTWDLNADLAKARAERDKENRSVSGSGNGFDELMGLRIWG
ncbi:hypothetical protein VTI74DRAFT_11056 [Chaetomium olivicolor]